MEHSSLSTASLHSFCCLQLHKRLLRLLLAIDNLAAVFKLIVVVFESNEAGIIVIIVVVSEWAIFLGFGKSLLVFKSIALLE